MKPSPINKRVVLGVEKLEDRITPAVQTGYSGMSYTNGYGDPPLAGINVPEADLRTLAGGNYKAILNQIVLLNNAPLQPWQNAVQADARSNGWNYTYANADPAGLQVTIRDYEATANAFMNIRNRAGLDVNDNVQAGAKIDISTNYVAPQGQVGVWIQLLTTNTPSRPNQPWAVIPVAQTYLDGLAGQANPFIGNNDARGFFDWPNRPNVTQNVTWNAVLYFGAANLATRAITIFPDGVQWGFQVQARPNNAPALVPTVTGAANPNPSVPLQITTITATLDLPQNRPANTPAPAGTVTFVATLNGQKSYLGQSRLALQNGRYTATLGGVGFDAGANTVTMIYSGDPNWQGATGTFVQTVNANNGALQVPSIDLTATPAAPGAGDTVSVTAHIAGASSPSPTGVVNFFVNGITFGSATIDSAGNATASSSAFPVGDDYVTAEYAGDSNFESAATSLIKTISDSSNGTTHFATSTRLTTSVSSSSYSDQVTLSANVTGAAASSGSPTGVVVFYDGTTELGTGLLDGTSTATLVVGTLPLGSNSLLRYTWGM